jgi:hypothetical protein
MRSENNRPIGTLDPMLPQEVNTFQMTFPANVGRLMPPAEKIPDPFWSVGNPYNRLASRWFYEGLKGLPAFKEGIDPVNALRHLSVVMCSFESNHEYKIATVAFLLHEWLAEPLAT